MTVKTIYICDKCGNEAADSKQFWTVGVTANCHTSLAGHFVTGMSMQVCRPCLESFGIHVQKKPKEEEAPKIPTLEEAIIEIIHRCT